MIDYNDYSVRNYFKNKQLKIPSRLEYQINLYGVNYNEAAQFYAEIVEETLKELNIEILVESPFGYAFGVVANRFENKLKEENTRRIQNERA